jgi:hypothetical protein
MVDDPADLCGPRLNCRSTASKSREWTQGHCDACAPGEEMVAYRQDFAGCQRDEVTLRNASLNDDANPGRAI